MLTRDWNQVLCLQDKSGGYDISCSLSSKFWDVINACKWRELVFAGPQYTRVNKREGSAIILERLDCAFCPSEWLHLFVHVHDTHLPHTMRDHYPILLSFDEGRTRMAGQATLRMLLA